MDENVARFSYRYHVLPAPAGLTMWCVWDDGEIESAPVPALAFAVRTTEASAEVQGAYRTLKTDRGHEYQTYVYDEPDEVTNSMDNGGGGAMHWFPTHVLLAVDWESSWVELGHRAFFTQDGATEVSQSRINAIKRKNKDKTPEDGVD